MARFSVDTLTYLIADNRNRVAQLASSAGTGNELIQRVVAQLELSVKILERHRDEMLANKARDMIQMPDQRRIPSDLRAEI